MATKKTPKKKRTTKAKKTSESKQSKKLQSISRTTGKSYEQTIERAKELEQVLGIHKMIPFKTNDIRILEEKMSAMNLTDLQALAVKAGVFPSGNTRVLKNKLRKAFKALGGSATVQITDKPFIDPTDPKNKAIVDLYNEGF